MHYPYDTTGDYDNTRVARKSILTSHMNHYDITDNVMTSVCRCSPHR